MADIPGFTNQQNVAAQNVAQSFGVGNITPEQKAAILRVQSAFSPTYTNPLAGTKTQQISVGTSSLAEKALDNAKDTADTMSAGASLQSANNQSTNITKETNAQKQLADLQKQLSDLKAKWTTDTQTSQDNAVTAAIAGTSGPAFPVGGIVTNLGVDSNGQQMGYDKDGNLWTQSSSGAGTSGYSTSWTLTQPAQSFQNLSETNPQQAFLNYQNAGGKLDEIGWENNGRPQTDSKNADGTPMSDAQTVKINNAINIKNQNDIITKGNNILQQYLNGTFPLTPDQQAQLTAVSNMWDASITAQKDANETYVNLSAMQTAREGGEYSQTTALSNAYRAIQTGLNDVNSLQQQKSAALAKLKQSFMDQDYKASMDNLNLIKDADKNISDSMQKTAEQLFSINKDQRDFAENQRQFNVQEQLNSDKFTWQQKMDIVDAELKKETLTEAQRHNLADEKLRYQEILNGQSVVVDDGYGGKVVVNKSTGAVTPINVSYAGGGLADDANSAYNTAVGAISFARGMSQADREALKGQVNNLLKNGDVDGAKQTILAAATANSPDAKTIMGRNTLIANLKDIQTLLNAYVAESGDTNIVSGSLEKVANKMGETTNPKLANIANRVTQIVNLYTKNQTGAQFALKEMTRYQGMFPGITNVTDLNAQKIGSLIEAANTEQKSELSQIMTPKAYDDLFGVKYSDPEFYIKSSSVNAANFQNTMNFMKETLGREPSADEVLQYINSQQ